MAKKEIYINGVREDNYAYSISDDWGNDKVVISYNSDNTFPIGKIVISREKYEKIIDYLIEESFIEDREDWCIPREVIAEASLSFNKIGE
tara:strand:+ start:296 stop:565 length:270 start_codon:yes stop_codon:yes gene_type:complete